MILLNKLNLKLKATKKMKKFNVIISNLLLVSVLIVGVLGVIDVRNPD